MASFFPDSTSQDHLLEHSPIARGQAHTSQSSLTYLYPSPSGTPILQSSHSPSIKSRSSETAVPNHGFATPKLDRVKLEHMTPSEVMSSLYYHAEFHPFKPGGSLVRDVKALKYKYERGGPRDGWSSFVTSTEGNLYFVNEETSAVTLTNIVRTHEAWHINAAIAQLRQEIDEAKFPEHTDLVVALATSDSTSSGSRPTVGYYLANWEHQVVTWAEGRHISQFCQNERAIISESHLELKLRAQFWAHARIFPNHRALPANAIEEFKDILVSKLSNGISQPQNSASGTTSTGQDAASLSQISSLLLEIKDGKMTPAMTLMASQSLQQIYDERFLSAWGEPGSQLDRSGGAAKKAGSRASFVFKVLAVFFAFTPHIYLRKLQASFDNENVHYLLWKRSMEEIRQHWGSLLLPSTVLFTGTLGFITISDFSQMKTPAQIIAVIVVILDFFVIVSTHFLKTAKDTNDMLMYLYDRRRSCMGLEGVAILFSVPLAGFIWSIGILIGDAAWVFFSNSTLQMKIALGLLVALLILLVILLIPFTLKPTMEQDQVSKLMDKLIEYIDRTFRPNNSSN